MARYIGPKSKISRRFGEPIFGPDKSLERKKYPPGQHGVNKRRGNLGGSEYSIQLKEKQKVKYTYGILERQFRGLFEKAARKKGKTGEILIQLCESRLDNVVYRLGLSPTRSGARQLVGHRHITVNGNILNIPSHIVSEGDIIAVREKSKNHVAIKESTVVNSSKVSKYDWLEWNQEQFKGTFLKKPEREMIPENINEQLIVELYSK